MDTYQVIDAFKAAMLENSIETNDPLKADGALHRFHITGHKPGSLNGAYKLHLDGVKPAGYFEDFTRQLKVFWKAAAPAKPITQAERQQLAETRAQREKQEQRKHEQAAVTAQRLKGIAKPVTGKDHPYLEAKNVESHGLFRLKTWTKRIKNAAGEWVDVHINNALIVPLIDINGALWSLQAIFPEEHPLLRRNKDFLSGGRQGGLFHAIGQPSHELIICEGYATGASLFEATGIQNLCALSAGNLLPVAEAVRAADPGKKIILAADNDNRKECRHCEAAFYVADNPNTCPHCGQAHKLENTGVVKAKKAAFAVGGLVAIPPIPHGDFNDYANREGIL